MGKDDEIPKLGDSYLLFKKSLYLWNTVTKIEEARRAGSVALRLPDKERSVILDVMTDTVLANGVGVDDNKKTGLECLIEEMDKMFLDNVEKETYTAYHNFRSLQRLENQSMTDFFIEFDKKARHLRDYNMELPTGVLAYELLNGARVSEQKADICRTTCSPWTYDNMKMRLKSVVDTHVKDSQQESIVKVKEESAFFGQEEYDPNYNEADEYGYEDTFYSTRGQGRYRGNTGYRRSYNRNSYNGYRGNGNYGQRWGTRPQRGARYQNYNNQRSTNPMDSNGNVMQCSNCCSIYHFVRRCPEGKFQSSKENITLFQNTSEYNQSDMGFFTYSNFGLAVLDSGCNTTVCGKSWLKSYLDTLDEEKQQKVKYDSNSVSFRFGDNTPTLSEKRVIFPAVVCNKDVNIAAQIVNDEIPLLISKKTMKDAKMKIDFSEDTVEAFGTKRELIITPTGHCSIPLTRQSVYDDICLCAQENVYLTNSPINPENVKAEALKLHKQFAHPPAEKLKKYVRKAGIIDKKLASEIENVTKNCEICRRYKTSNLKPIVSLPLAKDFGDCVAMDIKFYGDKIMFHHMIDHATKFSVATVIKSKKKEDIVEEIFMNWIAIFGRPKKFLSDNGGEYVNSSFMDMCDKLGVHVQTTGAEAPWSNGIVERHHALLTRNVIKIIEDTKCTIRTALAWAVNAKNTLSNIGGYSPYQLVFGANPSIPSISDPYVSPATYEDETSSEKVAEHIRAIYSARKEQLASDACAKIRRALRTKTRDVYSEDVKKDDLVFYKRDNTKRWRGPAIVTARDRKIVFLRHGGYHIKCHIVQVVNVNDLYNKTSQLPTDSPEPENGPDDSNYFANVIPEEDPEDETEQNVQNDEHIEINPNEIEEDLASSETTDIVDAEDQNKIQKLCDKKSTHQKKKISVVVNKADRFKLEKEEELQKWKDMNVYTEVHVNDDEIAENENICPISVRWVCTENGQKRKARLVARGYQEEPLKSTQTVSPTCRKESLRILFSITASMSWTIKSLDITSAFLQAKDIERLVYLIPPKECCQKDVLWRLKKCVYGLSDAAKLWYETIREQIELNDITKCPHDDAFFYKRDTSIQGMMSLHVDDFIYAGDSDFQDTITGSVLRDVNIKKIDQNQFTYLGLEVNQLHDNSITVSQNTYINNELQEIPIGPKRKVQRNHALSPVEYQQYRTVCGQLMWLSVQTRPDIAFDTCIINNNLRDPNVADINYANKVIKRLKQDNSYTLHFKAIPNFKDSMKIICYSDAAYNNLPNNGSQCGFIIFLCSKDDAVRNPIAWKSVRIERKCQSSLGAECLGMAKAVDHALFIQETVHSTCNRTNVPVEVYIDSKSLFDLLQKTKDPEEKRLLCVMAPIREMVDKKEININLIKSKDMPADILTKKGLNPVLIKSYLLHNIANG